MATKNVSMEMRAYDDDEDLPYAFVSYSHVDTARVECVLRIMYRQGLRFWYDQGGEGIKGGADWAQCIDNRFKGSQAFLVFISNGVEHRDQVMREVQMAIERHLQYPNYPVISVFLERVPLNVFPDDVQRFLQSTQFIPMYKYGGVTERFVKRLIGCSCWTEGFVDCERRSLFGLGKWSAGGHNLSDTIEDLAGSEWYVYPQGYPERRECCGVEFWGVTQAQTDPSAVYPICLDNQWVPVSVFSDPDFRERGFCSKEVRKAQLKMQRQEIFKALIHHRQVIINRASVFNSVIFGKALSDQGEEHRALRRLLESGAIVVYLMREKSPVQPVRFATENFRLWTELCRGGAKVCCLRKDWSGENENAYEVERSLAGRFLDFCLTLAEDRYLVADIAAALAIDDVSGLKESLQAVQRTVAGRDRERQPHFTREDFYMRFVVKEGSSVSQCRIDYEKPFACELKQLADFCYSTNLPIMLNLNPQLPTDCVFNGLDIGRNERQDSRREISVDELVCAVAQFRPAFLPQALRPEPDGCDSESLNFAVVDGLRGLDKWRGYTRAVVAGSKRARLNEVDFYDIAEVWQNHAAWLEQVKQSGMLPRAEWHDREACLSVVFHFATVKLTVVYHGSDGSIKVMPPGQNDLRHPALARKVPLVIDYVCGNVLLGATAESMLFTEQRLFEGRTKDPGRVTLEAVMLRLQEIAKEDKKL